MPWQTPTLAEVRRLNRDTIAARLPGADATVPNSVLRVLADSNAGLAHLTLLYLDYIASNLLPDRADADWLARWASIYFGGSKAAAFASGEAALTGIPGTLAPAGTELQSSDGVVYQTTADVVLGTGGASAPIIALNAGALGNRDPGASLSLSIAVAGVDAGATVVRLTGGADAEGTEDLRDRLLLRIRETPMGGATTDYEQWALAVPGVTRAFVSPQEMGIGTMTVRVLCDDLRASAGGFPTPDDLARVQASLDLLRPSSVRDLFVLAPMPRPLFLVIRSLSRDTASTRAAIEVAVRAMLRDRAVPGGTIYRSWVDEAISGALGEDSHELDFDTAVMPSKGHLAVLGSIAYA